MSFAAGFVGHAMSVITGVDRTEGAPFYTSAFESGRLPTDPIYVAAVTLVNLKVGGRYWIGRQDTGGVLAEGAVTVALDGDSQVIPGVPAFTTAFLLDIRIRNASPPGPYYRPFQTFAFHDPQGVSAYILQTED